MAVGMVNRTRRAHRTCAVSQTCIAECGPSPSAFHLRYATGLGVTLASTMVGPSCPRFRLSLDSVAAAAEPVDGVEGKEWAPDVVVHGLSMIGSGNG